MQLTNVSSEALDARRFTRAPFDDGEVPLRELVEAFDAAGYRGWYENEVLTEEPEDRVEFVREFADVVRRDLELEKGPNDDEGGGTRCASR